MTYFSAADESAHYAFSVGMLLSRYREELGWERDGVVELGSGDAAAVADVLAWLPELRVRGFDISAPSVERARANIAARGVAGRYTVELGDFFDSASWQADGEAGEADGERRTGPRTVVSNPPYIPAPDRDILMPELWGGETGNDLVLALLKAGYENAVLAIPSYADPATSVATAGDLGYRVANFLAMGLDYGPYSSEPKVAAHIRRLTADGRGWGGEDGYMVGVALFTRNQRIPGDRAEQLLHALQIGC